MSLLSVKRILTIIMVLSLATACCNAQAKSGRRNPEKALFGKSVNSRQQKVREPRAVVKAKKKQERNEAKLKRDSRKFIEESKKRAFSIQSAEVKERMKQDRKAIKVRDKERRKMEKAATNKAARKYKK